MFDCVVLSLLPLEVHGTFPSDAGDVWPLASLVETLTTIQLECASLRKLGYSTVALLNPINANTL